MKFLHTKKYLACLGTMLFLTSSVCIGIIFVMKTNYKRNTISTIEYIKLIFMGGALGFIVTYAFYYFLINLIIWFKELLLKKRRN